MTLEGDLYDPSGTLTGGSRAKGNASPLCKLGELVQLRKELADHEQKLAQLAAQLESCREQSERFQHIQSELEVKQHQLELHQQSMRSSQSGQLAGNLEKLKQQLAEQEQAAVSAKSALAECTKKRDELQAQLKDFEGNREERMAQNKSAIAAVEKKAKASAKAMETAKQAEQKLVAEHEQLEREATAAREQLADLETRRAEQAAAVEAKAAAELKKREQYEAAAAALQERKDALGGYDAERDELSTQRDESEKQRDDAQLELRQLEIRCGRAGKDIANAEAKCLEMQQQHPWIENERESFGQSGGAYDFKKAKPATAQQTLAKKTAELEKLNREINKSVLSQFEAAEKVRLPPMPWVSRPARSSPPHTGAV